ncbi:hypothetical protein KCU99_g3350, partial [Aureobasidium melanogenum]
MDLQLSPSSKARFVEDFGTDWPPKKPRDYYLDQPIFGLYRSYLKTQADAQDENLENLSTLCFRFQRCPKITSVERLIQEANIVNEKHRLNFPVYFFMQEFKFKMYIADETEQPSLFVGTIPHHGGQMEVWAHWLKSDEGSEEEQNKTALTTILYNTPHFEERDKLVLEVKSDWRKYIQWDEPLEQLFQLSNLTNRNLRSTVQVQNAILLSVAKVVIRFPGLMKLTTEQESKPDYVKATRVRVDFSSIKSRRSAKRKFPKAYDIFNSGPDLAKGVHRGQPPVYRR